MSMPSYAPLYAPLPDPGAYLARLGINPETYLRSAHPDLPESPSAYSMPHTKESLDQLVREHLFHVPFEDLDTYDLKRETHYDWRYMDGNNQSDSKVFTVVFDPDLRVIRTMSVPDPDLERNR